MKTYNVRALCEKIQTVVFSFNANVNNRYSKLTDQIFDWDIEIEDGEVEYFLKYCSKFGIKALCLSPTKISVRPDSKR